MTYNELLVRWEESIGGEITPGFMQRYERASERQGVALEDVRIGFKFCSEGMLTRFYVRKGESDCKAARTLKDCKKFSTVSKRLEFTRISPLWKVYVLRRAIAHLWSVESPLFPGYMRIIRT